MAASTHCSSTGVPCSFLWGCLEWSCASAELTPAQGDASQRYLTVRAREAVPVSLSQPALVYNPSLVSCHVLKMFLGGPRPSLPAPQLGDRAAELFHREMLACGAVCCLPPPATTFICLLPLLLCCSSALPAPEGWGWASFKDANGLFLFF